QASRVTQRLDHYRGLTSSGHRQRQWPNVCRALGREDLIDDPRYALMEDRTARRDELVSIIEAWMAGFGSAEEVVEALDRFRVPACRVMPPVEAIGRDRRSPGTGCARRR
ncbi:MAG: CoA transferase, partial [Actinomycetota bacterium]|nr:CoA transferase [Actinomycetota bacterium]